MKTTAPQAPFALATKLYYGLGSVAYGVKDNGFSFLLLIYYNQVLGLPASWVGGALMTALIFDAFSDPIVGYFSDQTHSKWGRRHPFMYASALPVAVSYFLLWNPPENLSPEWLLAYLIGMAILVRTCITLYEIPSSSLVAELTHDYDTRTSLMGFRYFFGWWGGLSMAVLAYLVLLPESKGGVLYAPGYQTYGLIGGGVMFIAIIASAMGTHKQIPTFKQPPPRRAFDFRQTANELRQTLSNHSFLVLFFSALLTAMAAGVSTSLNIYFNTFFWELTSEQIGILNLPYFIAAIVALAAAPRLSLHLGKKYAALTTALAACIGAPLPILLRLFDLMPANGTQSLFYTLVGFSTLEVTLIITAAILISAMVADVVEESELKTGRRSEGIFFAARSFAQKSVHGIGTFTATLILASIDFPTDAIPGDVPKETIRDLGLVYVPILMLLYIGSVGILTGYRISRESHAENIQQLEDAEDRTSDNSP